MDENNIYRYLHSQRLTPSLVWEKVESVIEYDFSHDDKGDKTASGYLMFDDIIIDKDFSSKTDGVRKQYSGKAHGLIKGIGVVACPILQPNFRHILGLLTLESLIPKETETVK